MLFLSSFYCLIYWIDVGIGLNLKEWVFGSDHDVLLLIGKDELYVGEVLFRDTLKFCLVEGHNLLNFIELLINFV